MEKKEILSLPLQISELSKVLVFSSVSILSFFVPFSLGHPQWFVGIIVNACLFLSVIFLPVKLYLPLIILPSIGVLSRGLIFGLLTQLLFLFIPFIWLGNLALIFIFKKFYLRYGFLLSMILASFSKFLILFFIANIYFKISFVPQVFLQTMGLSQLFTALAGGIVSYVIFKIYGKINTGTKRTN